LDKVTTRTIEIENTRSYVYECSYSEFVKRKAVNREIQRSHYEQQQKEIARLEEFIEQQRSWNRERNIIAAESRQKAIDRMEKIDAPEDLPDKVRMSFHANKKTGNDVLTMEALSKAYPAKPLFKNIDFKIKKGERVFLLGPNGCGKSTLLKIIQGILPQDSGTVHLGANVEIGYYDQEQTDLDPNSNILDELWKAKEEMTHTEVRNALSAFLFKGEEVFKTISILSGGEKGRVSLAKLMVKGDNFLLLDEPTNHLDINSREVLEQALLEYDGTILAVSHDRYFIDKLATRIIEMTDNGLFDINGNYSYFTEHKRKYREAEEAGASSKPNVTEGKQDYLSTKEDRANKRRQERQLKDTEDRIATVEARLEEIKNEMLDEKVACDHEKLQELHNEEVKLSQELDSLYELWGNLTE
jgi:ATP-binding cassette subfamily F protein 3